jgi:hypothetical protein
VLTIERFDLWFTPRRREIPIYVAGLFPKMLEIGGRAPTPSGSRCASAPPGS